MSSFFGTDNPYRAPTVARDVASFQGAFQEVARIEPPKADVLDFFYEGVQSYENMFAKQKQSYENKANELMAEIENQKAKDIMNGLTSDEVNKRYSEGYMALAESGQINKNLDAFKVLNRNNISARGAVVGDVAQDMLDGWKDEMARAGNSYTDRQRITEKWRRKAGYGQTQVGELFDREALPALRQARAEQSRAEVTRATNSVITSAYLGMNEVMDPNNQDARNEYIRTMFDPNQGPVPPVIDEDGNPSMQSLEMMGNSIYQTQFEPLLEGASPEQRDYMEDEGRKAAADMAAKILATHQQDIAVRDRMQENVETTANFADLLSAPEEALNDLPTGNMVELDNGLGDLPVHMKKETLLAGSFALAGKAVSENDDNPAAFTEEMWGTGDTAYWKQAMAAALNTDNPTQALLNLRRSFPSEKVDEAIEMGYVPKGTSPEQWRKIRNQYKNNVDRGIALQMSQTMGQQIEAIRLQNPAALVQQLPIARAQVDELSYAMGLDPTGFTAFTMDDSPGSARSLMATLKGQLQYEADKVAGKKGGGSTAQIQRQAFVAQLGASEEEQTQIHMLLQQASAESGNKARDRREISEELTGRLSDITDGRYRGAAGAGELLLRKLQLDEQVLAGRDAAGIPRGTYKGILNRTAGLAQDILDSQEALADFPDAADGLLNGALLFEVGMLVPNFKPDKNDPLALSMRERIGEGDVRVPTSRWISSAKNQQYARGMMDQVESAIREETEGLTPTEVAKRGRKLLVSYLGEDGYDKILAAAQYAGDSEKPKGSLVAISQGQSFGAIQQDRMNELILTDQHLVALKSNPEEFSMKVLEMWANGQPPEGQDALLRFASGSEIILPRDSSIFVSNYLEDQGVLKWGYHDSDTERNHQLLAVAIQNDPLAQDLFQMHMREELLNGTIDLYSARTAKDDGQAMAEAYATAAARASVKLMETHGIASDGTLVKFSEDGLDRETHAWALTREAKGEYSAAESAGRSIFYGNTEDWAAATGQTNQDWTNLIPLFVDLPKDDGTLGYVEVGPEGNKAPVHLGRGLAIVHQSLRHATIEVDGEEVGLIDHLITDEDGKADREFMLEYKRILQTDPNIQKDNMHTHLYAILKAGHSTGKWGSEPGDIGYGEDSEGFAQFLVSTKNLGVQLISDQNSPTGYSLQLPNLIALPWAAPLGSHKNAKMGRDWPDEAGYIYDKPDVDVDDFNQKHNINPYIIPGKI